MPSLRVELPRAHRCVCVRICVPCLASMRSRVCVGVIVGAPDFVSCTFFGACACARTSLLLLAPDVPPPPAPIHRSAQYVNPVPFCQLASGLPLKRVPSLYGDERQVHGVASLVHPSVLARQLRFTGDAWMARHPRLASSLSLFKEVCVW
jgi:hypothetical protein